MSAEWSWRDFFRVLIQSKGPLFSYNLLPVFHPVNVGSMAQRGPAVEVLSRTASRLTVVDFQPGLSGNYNCSVGGQVASILLSKSRQ